MTYTNNQIFDPIDEGKIEVDGIFYYIQDRNAVVTYRNDKFISYSGDVIIPSTISYDGSIYNVTEIGTDAFRSCKLNNLTIGNNIRKINASFFLTTINNLIFDTPSNLEEVAGWAFNDCNIENICLPDGVRIIWRCAFQNCKAKTIDIPSSVQMISNNAFTCCTNLREVYVHWNTAYELPELPPDIDHIFDQCNFNEITLIVPNGSTEIYSNAHQWSDLKIIEIGDYNRIDELTNNGNNKHIIFNLSGICINKDASQMDIDNLPSGIYVIDGKKTYIQRNI